MNTNQTENIQKNLSELDKILLRSRGNFISVSIWVGIISLGYYAIFYYINSQNVGFVGSVAMFLYNLSIMYVLKVRKNIKYATYMILVMLVVFLGYFIFVDQNTLLGFVNLKAIPLITFFLLGKKKALPVIIFMTGLLLLGFGAHFLGVIKLEFSNSLIVDFLINYFVYIFLLLGFQDIQEKANDLLKKHAAHINQSNKKLGLEIDTRKKAELELKKNAESLEKMNKMMVGRELRMAELKEEIASLKGGSDEAN